MLTIRWAVKEAAYKALNPTYIPSWKELSYFRPEDGRSKPRLVYTPTGGASPPLNLRVSVSHDADLVCAFVVAETVDRPP
jgi:holo-[acyl-carrier protein] synthase